MMGSIFFSKPGQYTSSGIDSSSTTFHDDIVAHHIAKSECDISAMQAILS